MTYVFILDLLKKLLSQLASSQLGRRILAWIFRNMRFARLSRPLLETDTLLAFQHPKPSYPVHILIVPKKEILALVDLTRADEDFMCDLFLGVKQLVNQLELGEMGYRLIANGGLYQEFPYLHFHLVSGTNL